MKLCIYPLNKKSSLWFQYRVNPNDLAGINYRLTDSCIVHEVEKRKILLINTLSGAADYIVGLTVDELIIYLKKNIGDRHSNRIKKHFFSRGYLYKNKREEDQVRRYVLEYYDREKKRYQFYITLTTSCNFACTYCFQKGVMKTHGTLSAKELMQCFEGIRRYTNTLQIDPRETNVVLYGGEPLLYQTKDLVDLACKMAAENGWNIIIVTNGYMLKEYKSLLSRYRKTILTIITTLDGPERIHNERRFLKGKQPKGTFRRIVEGVETAASLGIYVKINVNLDPSNVNALQRFSKFVRCRSWNRNKNIHIDLLPVVDPFRKNVQTFSRATRKDLSLRTSEVGFRSILYDSVFVAQVAGILQMDSSSKKKATFPLTYGCTDLKTYILHVDGKIYPCLDLSCLGKLSIGRWKPRWNINKRLHRRFERTGPLYLSKCRSCSMVAICGGPCPARHLLKRRKPDGKWCRGKQAALESVSDYLKRNEQNLKKRLSLLRKPALTVNIDL